MPLGCQLVAQGDVVVDLSVCHQVNRAVFIRKRLLTGFDVDNRQTTHAQTNTLFDELSTIEWSSMAQSLAHEFELG